MKKVLIIGSTCLDIASWVDQLPRGNEDIHPQRTEYRVSGSGWCMANAFRMLNMPYDLISPVGTGVYSETVRQMAQEYGIILKHREETAGCTYTLIDPEGNTGMMMVGGSEYSFSVNDIPDFDPEDYAWILLSGTQFEQDPQTLLGFVQSAEIPVIFQPGGRSVLMNEQLMKQIYDLHPVLHINEAEASYLCEGRAADLNEAAQYLCSMTEAPVIILLNDMRCLCFDGEEEYLIEPQNHDRVDLSGTMEGHAAAWTIARCSGLNMRKALEFAEAYAETVSVTDETIPDQAEENRLRQQLAGMILSTDYRNALKTK